MSLPSEPRLRFARLRRAALVVFLLMQGLVSAQDVTDPALKAAFIYNFTKFTEWPEAALPAAQPFVLCVLGDSVVSAELARAVRARAIEGRSLTVSYLEPGMPQPVCHVLYVSRVTTVQASQVVARLRDVPVLTISDLEGFTELGGIAQFFFEQGRLRFNVHIASATRAHLRISSRLLALAKRHD